MPSVTGETDDLPGPFWASLIESGRQLGLSQWSDRLCSASDLQSRLQTLASLSHQSGPEQLYRLGSAMPEQTSWRPLHQLELTDTGARRDQAMAIYGGVAVLVPEVKICPHTVHHLGCTLTAPHLTSGLLVHFAHILSGILTTVLTEGPTRSTLAWSISHDPQAQKVELANDQPHNLNLPEDHAQHETLERWLRATLHATQNALMVIEGQMPLIRNDVPSSNVACERIDEVARSAKRLRAKVISLRYGLALWTDGQDIWSPLDTSVIAATHALRREYPDTEVDITTPRDLALKAPKDVVMTILLELLRNAAQACERAGVDGPIKLSMASGSNGLDWVLTDGGTQALPDILKRATLPFITHPADLPNGVIRAGFGLTLVSALLDRLGGTLSLAVTGLGGCRATVGWPKGRVRAL